MNYLVVLNANSGRTGAITAAIKAMGEWAELAPSTYLLDSEHSAGSILERLQPMLGPSDGLWVVTATEPWSGYGDVLIDDALHARLGPAEDYIPRDWNEATRDRS